MSQYADVKWLTIADTTAEQTTAPIGTPYEGLYVAMAFTWAIGTGSFLLQLQTQNPIDSVYYELTDSTGAGVASLENAADGCQIIGTQEVGDWIVIPPTSRWMFTAAATGSIQVAMLVANPFGI